MDSHFCCKILFDLSSSFTLPSNFVTNTPTSYIEKTLEKMQEKVSHFLVQQMDKQLDKMFESTNSYTPESPDRVTSTYEPSSVDQKGGQHC
jgi:hypothetical protein